MRDLSRKTTSRRRFLAVVGSTGMAAVLAACVGPGAVPTPTAALPPAVPTKPAAAAPAATPAPAAAATAAPTTAPAAAATPASGATTAVQGTPAAAKPAGAGTPGGTLKLMRGGGNDAFWSKVFDGFKAKTGITVETITNTGTVEDGTVPTALKSGAGPDVVLINSGPARIGFLAQAGLTKPLDDVYKQLNWTDRLVPFAVNRLKNQGKIFQGKIWEVPWSLDVIYWNYNKDLYGKVGIKAPDTYDEMIANFEKLKAAKIYPVTLGVRSSFAGGWLFGNLMQAMIGRDGVADVLFGEGKWDQPRLVQAAATLQDWVKKEYIPQAATTLTDQQAYPLFLNKQAANYCVGTWFVPTMAEAKADMENVDTFSQPPITKENSSRMPTGGFGSSYVVAANARDPDTAYKYLDYYMTDEVTLLIVNYPNQGTNPPVKIPPGAKPNRFLAKSLDILAHDGTGYNPSVHVVATITNTYYQSLQGLLGGQTTPQQAMADIQAAKVKAAQA
jgi:raffinose/stachyose/melibiose transport system substrate-binding protein